MDVELRIRLSDGDERWISTSGRYQLAADGSIETLTAICIDVTRRKHAQEALRLSEARLSSAADLAGLWFYEADLGKDASYHVDHRFHDLCGLPADRGQGIQPLEFWVEHLHPDDRERVLDHRQQLHDGRLSQISLEYRYLHTLKPARSGSPISDASHDVMPQGRWWRHSASFAMSRHEGGTRRSC